MPDPSELQNFLGYIIIFIVLAIAIGLGADVLEDIRDTQTNTAISHANETLTWAGNNTGIKLAASDLVSGSEALYNNGTKTNKGLNYTIDNTGGSITITNLSCNLCDQGTNHTWITGALNLSYDYYIGSAARNITKKGLDSQITFSKWLPTLALVLIIAVIIAVLLIFLKRKFMD